MSANQLARKANALRKELRDTVKSLQPEKYAALEKELKEVEKAYGHEKGGRFRRFPSFPE